jgi:hypothetical protein
MNKPDIKGTFIFFEKPGSMLRFYHKPDKNSYLKTYYFQDMKEYVVPWDVAHNLKFDIDRLNNSGQKVYRARFHFSCDCVRCRNEFDIHPKEKHSCQEKECADFSE